MKREKRLTRKERQLIAGGPKGPNGPVLRRGAGQTATLSDTRLDPGTHLHCVACGKHLETVGEARERAAAGLGAPLWAEVACAHGSVFHACLGCVPQARMLLEEHDRTGNAVRAASAWH
ncbi:MAG: hypothetical protein JNK72_11580 [Myxococcales bacterium]|nr:hypothetical protein [Myxococcales bacterium]